MADAHINPLNTAETHNEALRTYKWKPIILSGTVVKVQRTLV